MRSSPFRSVDAEGAEVRSTDFGGAPEPLACVEFELTPEEWVEVSLQHSLEHPMTRKAMGRVRALFAALMVVLALLTVLGGFGSLALVWILGGGVAFAALGPLLRHSQQTHFRRYAEQGIANGTFGHHRVELREDGFLDATDAYERLTRWPAIERVEQGEHAFLIYMGPNAFMPIPHSAFADSAALRRFSDVFHTLRGAEAPPELPSRGGDEAP